LLVGLLFSIISKSRQLRISNSFSCEIVIIMTEQIEIWIWSGVKKFSGKARSKRA